MLDASRPFIDLGAGDTARVDCRSIGGGLMTLGICCLPTFCRIRCCGLARERRRQHCVR